MIEIKETKLKQIDTVLFLIDNNVYPKEWRLGQAVFNMLYIVFPREVNKLRGTDADCFHKNDKIEIFIDAIKEQFEEVTFKSVQEKAFNAARDIDNPLGIPDYNIEVYGSLDMKYKTFEEYYETEFNTRK